MTAAGTAPSTEELQREIEAACARRGTSRRVTAIDRQPSRYRTSAPLEELIVSLDGGEQLDLLLKDLSRRALSEDARRAKPSFLHDPRREIETYRTLLAPSEIGAAFYGAGADERADRYWLLLERVVDGVELYQVGELDRWHAVARWLARLHERFRSHVDTARTSARLLDYEPAFYRLWLDRARRFTSDATHTRLLDHVARHHDRVIDRLSASPPTIIHGEFYASNVLIEGNDAVRVVPVDWETTAAGPALVDLAALAAGWDEDARERLTDAYRDELVMLDRDPGRDGFAEELACCRLHVAIQWLGWSRSWSPPPGHRQDWLAEATTAVEELGL